MVNNLKRGASILSMRVLNKNERSSCTIKQGNIFVKNEAKEQPNRLLLILIVTK